MIYRSSQGSLYLLKGYASPFSKSIYDRDGQTIKNVIVAKFSETGEFVNVLVIDDKKMNSTYYAYEVSAVGVSGVMCLYRDTRGFYWLVEAESAYKRNDKDEFVTNKFEPLYGEHLFDVVSDIINEK